MSGRALPEDAEAYVLRAKEKASPTGKVMEELTKARETQLLDTLNSIKIEQASQQLEDLRKKGKQPTVQQAENIAAQLFKGKSPDEIREILAGMTPQMIQNLQMLAQAVDTNPVTAVLRTQQMQPPPSSSSRDDLLLKLLIEQQSKSTDQLITFLKIVKELQPAPPPAPSSGSNLLDTVKTVAEIQRPFIESQGKNNKELFDLRIREIESKIPEDPISQLKYYKEAASALGLGGGRSEIDLKLEEMRQNREVDMRRLDWEQKKYEMDKEGDNEKWAQLANIFEGPIGKAIQNFGSAGADRVRGTRGNSAADNAGIKAVQTQCPNCNKAIYVDADADTALCGNCGVTLQRQGGVVPQPQPKPAPTHVNSQPETEPETKEAEVEEQQNENDEEEQQQSENEPEQQ